MFSENTTLVLSYCVLAVLGGALVVWIVVYFRRANYTSAQTALLTWNKFMTRVLWRAEVIGALHVGPRQGIVIVSNHRCPFDPGFVALGADRVMRWMVAKEYCENRFMRPFLMAFDVVPTSRSGHDTAATKRIIRHAEEGELVGLFPEGRINDTDRFMLPGRPGVALIALKARVPIVPCYIEGAPYDKRSILGCLFMPAKVRVIFGQPIDLSAYYGRENEREVLDQLTKHFMREIAKLADRPDFEPEIAGRKCNNNGQ